MTELSDDLLVAYVDGRLADKQSGAVARVLEQDDVLARRVRALKSAHGRLEAAFDAILAGGFFRAVEHCGEGGAGWDRHRRRIDLLDRDVRTAAHHT